MCDNCRLFNPGDDLAKNVADYVDTLNAGEALAILGSLAQGMQSIGQDLHGDTLSRLASLTVYSSVALQLARRLVVCGCAVDHEIYPSADAFFGVLASQINERINAHLAAEDDQ